MVKFLKVREAMVSNPITLDPNALIVDAAKTMRDKKIGSVILAEDGKLIGIATERDLIRRVIAENKDPKKVKISEIMSTPVVTISPNEDVVDAAKLMRRRGIRRLVVMAENDLVGVITTDDIASNMSRAVEELAITLYLMDKRQR